VPDDTSRRSRFGEQTEKCCIQYSTVHLNITLDEELYERLKAQAPAKKLSAFIADALRAARWGPDEAELARAYEEAANEPWRRALQDEWATTEADITLLRLGIRRVIHSS
jgi:hypothetical protein